MLRIYYSIISYIHIHVYNTGGSSRSISYIDTIHLDASSSIDLNLPSNLQPSLLSTLTYKWTCIETYPNYGNICTNFTTTAGPSNNHSSSSSDSSITQSVYTAKASDMMSIDTTRTSLLFTVYVSNSAGFISSTSVDLSIYNTAQPTVTINSTNIKTVYYSGDIIFLTGYVTSVFPIAYFTSWSSTSFDLTMCNLTTVYKHIPATTATSMNTFQLAFTTTTLTAGRTYTISLSAAYISSVNSPSSSLVSIVLSYPPTNGILTVTPSIGTVSDIYTFQTSGWVAAPGAGMLTYTFSYYTLTPTNSIIIKNIDSRTYTTTTLPQGKLCNNYTIICIVNATDTYGGMSTARTTIQVYPKIQNSSSFQHDFYANPPVYNASDVSTDTSIALSNYDSAKLSQIISTTISTLTTLNTLYATNNNNTTNNTSSNSINCTALNRGSCSDTIGVCGVCMHGYIGEVGDANTLCTPTTTTTSNTNTIHVSSYSSSSVPSLVTRELQHSCLLGGEEVNGICIYPQQQCIQNCSGQGECIYYDINNIQINTCDITNAYCHAVCICQPNYYSVDCCMNRVLYTYNIAVREKLCHALVHTLAFQDVTNDVVLSRTSSIIKILSDMSLISEYALCNCSIVLLYTIETDPVLVGTPALASAVVNTLSQVRYMLYFTY